MVEGWSRRSGNPCRSSAWPVWDQGVEVFIRIGNTVRLTRWKPSTRQGWWPQSSHRDWRLRLAMRIKEFEVYHMASGIPPKSTLGMLRPSGMSTGGLLMPHSEVAILTCPKERKTIKKNKHILAVQGTLLYWTNYSFLSCFVQISFQIHNWISCSIKLYLYLLHNNREICTAICWPWSTTFTTTATTIATNHDKTLKIIVSLRYH